MPDTVESLAAAVSTQKSRVDGMHALLDKINLRIAQLRDRVEHAWDTAVETIQHLVDAAREIDSAYNDAYNAVAPQVASLTDLSARIDNLRSVSAAAYSALSDAAAYVNGQLAELSDILRAQEAARAAIDALTANKLDQAKKLAGLVADATRLTDQIAALRGAVSAAQSAYDAAQAALGGVF
jgi:chromosome segregation ATPase